MGDDYHEKETITLTAGETKSRSELHSFLKSRGFKSEDEFYFVDRPDSPKPWQAISVMTVNVFNQGSAVYETEEDVAEAPGQWDELKVEYLLASLPQSFIEKCAIECETLAAQFDLQMELGGEAIKPGQLQSTLQKIADKLTSELNEPGSETLGILIAQSYGR
ncbi:hypothetical protein Rhal01_03212 [Rubritalea halochordaticola]|uniref:DUF4304 domain-containing protein n=1 Tax=Rubritalea halochordaticola TaxID=714537 RepID=A0ABP9V2Y8_9BACT